MGFRPWPIAALGLAALLPIITNSVRHARAGGIQVTLTERGPSLEVSVLSQPEITAEVALARAAG